MAIRCERRGSAIEGVLVGADVVGASGDVEGVGTSDDAEEVSEGVTGGEATGAEEEGSVSLTLDSVVADSGDERFSTSLFDGFGEVDP